MARFGFVLYTDKSFDRPDFDDEAHRAEVAARPVTENVISIDEFRAAVERTFGPAEPQDAPEAVSAMDARAGSASLTGRIPAGEIFEERAEAGDASHLGAFASNLLDNIPTELKAIPRWVGWRFEVRNGKRNKVPVNVRTGRAAIWSNPDRECVDFKTAIRLSRIRNLEGVGFIFEDDIHFTAIDLDDVRDEDGNLAPHVAEVLYLKESYAEWSPSGNGVHIITGTKIVGQRVNHHADVEIYGNRRFLTITGRLIDGSPSGIHEAPKTIELLTARVDEFDVIDAAEKAQAGHGDATKDHPKADASDAPSPWRAVNDAAIRNYDKWVPAIFPHYKKLASGVLRVASEDRGRRDLQEDISFAPGGIKDFGVEVGRTAIDIVQEFLPARDAIEASRWLCGKLGLDPRAVGFRWAADKPKKNHRKPEPSHDPNTGEIVDEEHGAQDAQPEDDAPEVAEANEAVIDGDKLDIDDADSFVEHLVNKTREDAGFPYQSEVFDELRAINNEDPIQWARITKALKDAKILIKSDLERLFREATKRERDEEKNKRRQRAESVRNSASDERTRDDGLPGSWGRFTLKHDGLHAEVQKGSGENTYTESVWVCSRFEILGETRDASSNSWGKLLSWRDGKGCIHTVIVPDAEAHGEPKLLASRLSDHGLRINRNAQALLATFLTGANVNDYVVLVDRTGWHHVGGHRVFVLPKETIAARGAPNVVLRGSSGANYASAGSLDDWKNTVGRLASDQSMMRLSISAALAGPLLELARIPGGGIHFQSPSSKGKSTLMCSTASVWGRGTESGGFMRQWRATTNGLESAAVEMSDTALVLDEIGQVEGRELASAVYSLANGVGKQRADRKGEAREARTWRVLTISTGEIRVGDKINDDGRRQTMTGQTLRLLDIDAIKSDELGVFDSAGEFESTADLVVGIKDAAARNYGTAGPEFVRRLINNNIGPDDIADTISRFAKDNVPDGSDAQIGRAANMFGLIAAAGEIGIWLGVLPWEPGSVESAAACAFKDWISRRGGTSSGEETAAVARVRGFIEQHGGSRFDDADNEYSEDGLRRFPVRDRLGWTRKLHGETEYLFAPETWKIEVCRGMDYSLVAKALLKRGMLRKNKGRDLTCRVRLKDGTLPRVFVVSEKIMEGDCEGGDE